MWVMRVYPTRIYDVYRGKDCMAYLGIYDATGDKVWDYPQDRAEWRSFLLGNNNQTEIEQQIAREPNRDEFLLSDYTIRRRRDYQKNLNCPKCGRTGAVSFQERENPVYGFPTLTIDS